jgi:RNA polymerase sigma factor (sigma-70 family)
MDNAELLDLIHRACAGATDAANRLVGHYIPRLQQYLAGLTKGQSVGNLTVDDLTQNVMYKCMRSLQGKTFPAVEAFQDWFFKIAKTAFLDAIRKANRHAEKPNQQSPAPPPNLHESLCELIDQVADSIPTASVIYSRHEGVRKLLAAIDRLEPEIYRLVVDRYHLQGQKLDEIAAQLQKTPDAVRGILNRAIQKLRADLGGSSMPGIY